MPKRPTQAAATAAPAPLPGEVVRDDWTVVILAVMMFLAPALGVPTELMLQDTLKSIIVAMAVLSAALLFFLQMRGRREPLRWHGLLWLPLALLLYALGSMAWSHAYLGGVEAVRWFVFTLLLWLGLNTLARDRLAWLAWGVHAGAVGAALWAALQFWVDFDLFPQGPNPASTFVNRNFFAEFVVCTLPFSMLLLGRARASGSVVALAVSNGLIITTILMTGTRAALIALWLQLLVVWPLIAWRCRRQFAWPGWTLPVRVAAPLVLALTVLVLGLVPSANPKILVEERGAHALARAFTRTQSIGPRDYSLGVRMEMWRATLNIIQARPFTGVGAGAWESEVPLYQAEGSQLETDYYVHNEFLQLLAEYGLVGWTFLVLLFTYLIVSAGRTWKAATETEDAEALWRATLLCSLLALMVVSCIGFPWRMAATGALFALCLAGLAASDARLGHASPALAQALRWTPALRQAAIAVTCACIALALFITQRAAESERKIVSAAKIALAMSASGRPDDPRWRASREEMLRLVREGVAINPHYRKITPMVADELAKWGDWANATWIWESVLSSRPNVVAIISNAARGYSSTGQPDKALAMLERAKRIQPRAPSVRSLEVVLLGRAGKEAEALRLAKAALAAGVYDYDLVNALFVLASRAKEFALAEQAMALRVKDWPESQSSGQVRLGLMYATGMNDAAKARAAFRAGLAAAADPAERDKLLAQIPPPFRQEFTPTASLSPQASYTSSSSR
ncbi:O-antigen ligase family protein [Caenimonas sedimenti]|uniref:O-antigen ligase family protein n=1 Tax=Caenimonas sedimenti TaxID=2596921 RepID=A0A562ZI86_9BURK|nr:O-antigen ligase family protein [Caenimonas sedimenti]TWO68097.1 O-antigen ligase family protein [Caenimonas sedimenti]